MLLLRRVATGVVIVAALAVVALSFYLLWNDHPNSTSDLQLQEKLIVILLGISGLYVIVFILTADFNARSSRRALENVRKELDDSMLALKGLKDEIKDALRAGMKDETRAPTPDLQEMMDRLSLLVDAGRPDEQKPEIEHYERALPALELLQAGPFRQQLGRIYRILARYYQQRDAARSHFYLARVQALTPEDFETANELATLALDRRPPDHRDARRYFEASLAARPDQQRAKYGLARIALAEGDLQTAIAFLGSALESPNWETAPDTEQTALVRYTLACTLARRAQSAPAEEQSHYFQSAAEQLKAAFTHPSRRIEEMFSRDTEEGGDLFVLANTAPYEDTITEMLMNVSVGAA